MRKYLAYICIFLIAAGEVRAGGTEYAACFKGAEAEFGISAELLWSIAKRESNFNPGAVNRNKNGSFDFGIMQINTIHYKTIGKDAWNRLGDPCYNIRVGAWLLSQCIRDYGYSWKAVGCYNSRTPEKSKIYAQQVFKILQKFRPVVKAQASAPMPSPTATTTRDAILEALGE